MSADIFPNLRGDRCRLQLMHVSWAVANSHEMAPESFPMTNGVFCRVRFGTGPAQANQNEVEVLDRIVKLVVTAGGDRWP